MWLGAMVALASASMGTGEKTQQGLGEQIIEKRGEGRRRREREKVR